MSTPAGAVRPGLRRWLAGTALLSALALWWPADPSPGTDVSAAVDRRSDVFAPVAAATASPMRALPATLPFTDFATADFDPFTGVAAATPMPQEEPAPPPPPPPEPAPAVEAPPAPPPANYRYLGRMTDPDGKTRLYLSNEEKAFPVEVGTRLPDGYVVDAMDAAAVHLHYPLFDARAQIPLPPPPDTPSR